MWVLAPCRLSQSIPFFPPINKYIVSNIVLFWKTVIECEALKQSNVYYKINDIKIMHKAFFFS